MSKQFPKCARASLWAVILCCFLASCNKDAFNEYSGTGGGIKPTPEMTGPHDILYIQTNNYQQGQNAILAYRVYADGNSVLMDGGPFLTGGTGLHNTQNPGTFDSDQEVKISADKKFLLTVNSGDNTISVFTIQPDGTLKLVPGAPFSSGGETPVSIDQWQQYIIVLNKSNNPIQPSSSAPNYSVFTLESNGTLTPVNKFELRPGICPAQVLVSRTGAFMYGSNNWGFDYTPPAIPLNLTAISGNGKLIAGPDAPPMNAPNSGALGLCQSWKQNVLYVAFPFSGQFSFFEMNTTTGGLTPIGNVPARPGCSRFGTNNLNDRLFTANTIENSVSMFDITNARAPHKTGDLVLKKCGPLYTGYFGQYTTSQCVAVAAGTDDKLMYTVSQHTNADLTIGNYNYLHILQVVPGAGLQEKNEPVQLPVENKYRPRGLAVLRAAG